EERLRKTMRLEAEVEQAGVYRVIVVLLTFHPRGREVLHLHGEAQLAAGGTDLVSEVRHRELFRELVEDAILPGLRGGGDGEFDAADGCPDVEEPTGLPAFSVDGEWHADGRLHAEAVERGAENLVIVEAIDEAGMAGDLVGHRTVDDTLVEVRRAQPPDP